MGRKKETKAVRKTKTSKTSEEKNKHFRENIKCRICFMVDGYAPEEDICKHCGSKIFRIDSF